MNRSEQYYQGPWFVYILLSNDGRKTYPGATKYPDHRLRQHNGELCGGAKTTRTNRPWTRKIFIRDLPNSHYGLCLEAAIRRCRSGGGLIGRCKSLRKVLTRGAWSSTCKGDDVDIHIECDQEYAHYFADIPRVTVTMPECEINVE